MTLFQGFEGPAGTGKTHHLIEAVGAQLRTSPLAAHQRVLALTFMHGSRRRLDEKFSKERDLRGRYVCATIDSFAHELEFRWRSMVPNYDAMDDDFNRRCDRAGTLLEIPQIVRWVATTFPVVVVDEAQELAPQRLRIIRALTSHVHLYAAADEFQCLDEKIDTAPFLAWFHTGSITRLSRVRRTKHRGLLEAAAALRNGEPPVKGDGLTISYEFKNQMPFAIGHALRSAPRDGTTAIIVAPGSRQWADSLIERFAGGLQSSKQSIPPIKIGWEARHDDEVAEAIKAFGVNDAISVDEILRIGGGLVDAPEWMAQCLRSVTNQRNTQGQESWSIERLQRLMERRAALHRAYGYQSRNCIPIMTIRGAKNRQFRNVVVLWGPGVHGDEAQQRRLLYNAITRAEVGCKVFVRTEQLLKKPPFANPTNSSAAGGLTGDAIPHHLR
jgi:superfamily I DNA/RNA helicase